MAPALFGRRMRTVFAVLVALLAVVAVAADLVWQDHERTWKQAEALTVDTAKVVDAHVKRTVRGADIALQQAANMVEEAGGLEAIGTDASWRRLREYAANIDGGQSLWLFDREGNVLLSTTGPFPGYAINVADRTYYQAAMAGGGRFLGPAIRNKVNGGIIVTVSRPLKDRTGTVIGGVAAAMDTKWLTDFYALMDFGLSPTITVFRLDGSVVARRPDLESVLGRSNIGGQLFQEHLPNAPDGVYLSTSKFDGKERLAAYRLSEELGILVFTGIETDAVFAPWRQRSLWFLADMAAMLGLIVLAIVWGARSQREVRHTQHRLLMAEALTEQINAELQSSRRDPLTHLPNRGLFLEMSTALIDRSRNEGVAVAVLFVDLDGFKDINDRKGHGKGDEVLIRTAATLQALTRAHDLVGRFGGDEFTVCIAGPPHTLLTIARGVASRMVDQIASLEAGLGCSIGIALLSSDCPDLSCALEQADKAMYAAKRAGKGRYAVAPSTACPSCEAPSPVAA